MGAMGLLFVAASFTACSTEDGPGDVGGAGSGGEAVGGDAPRPHAGTGGGGSAGEGGAGHGGITQIGDYRVLETFDTRAHVMVSWPEQKRLAVADFERSVIQLFDVNASEAGIELTDELEPAALLPGATLVAGLAKYGDDLLVVVSNGVQPVQQTILRVHGTGAEPLLELPPDAQISAIIADPDVGVAVKTGAGVLFAKTGAAGWTTLVPERRPVPLAFDGERVLVGIDELDRLELDAQGEGGAGGMGGAGGQGGEGNLDASAHVRWLDLEGKQLQDFVAFGNPQVAVKDDAGWLIGETNSFWGSYDAGIELLTDTGLELLTEVPVVSAGDGTDGAYDLVHFADQLLVANCESGLLRSSFSTSALTLAPVAGPWELGTGECGVTVIEAIGDTLAVGGGKPLVFLKRQ